MLNGVPKLEGEFRLFVKYPTANIWMMIDDRWMIEKVDDKTFRVSPSLMHGDNNDENGFHTTSPFLIEMRPPKLTIHRSGEDV